MSEGNISPEARLEIEKEIRREQRAASFAAGALVLAIATIIGYGVFLYTVLTMSPRMWEFAGHSTVLTLATALMFGTGISVF